MDILIKILMVAFTAAVLVCIVIALDRRIARRQLLARSLLYAFAFTPTAYHHAPNTIVAPLHLSTIFGNLFYGYDYTAGMFIWGVAAPLLCGWMLIMIVLLFRLKLPEQLSKSPAK
jgi:hypothetical protein